MAWSPSEEGIGCPRDAAPSEKEVPRQEGQLPFRVMATAEVCAVSQVLYPNADVVLELWQLLSKRAFTQ